VQTTEFQVVPNICATHKSFILQVSSGKTAAAVLYFTGQTAVSFLMNKVWQAVKIQKGQSCKLQSFKIYKINYVI